MRRTLLALLLLASVPVVARPARADEREDRRSAIVRAVERVRPGVVSIRTNEISTTRYYSWFDYEDVPREREGSLGSGAIFHPQGFVLTNAHVISRASRIFVQVTDPKVGDYEREANVVSVDLENDLAILKLLAPPPGAEGATYPWLPFGASSDLMIGETVIAIGNPFRLGITVTTGIVSALRRSIRPPRGRETEFRDFVQTDAAINPGNSGGPLLDVNGRWIGVNTAILNRATGAEGIGFAIPIDRAREMVGRTFKRRIARGDWLGFELEAGRDGAPLVKEVSSLGPAVGSRLAKGDRIVSVDGTPTPTLFDYRLAEISLPAGATAHLRVVRGDAETIDVSIPMTDLSIDALAKKRLGFSARDLRAEEAVKVGSASGILVTDVVEGGPGDLVSLRKGDVVVGLGEFPVRSVDDLVTFLELVQPGDKVDLHVKRLVRNGNVVTPVDAHGTLTAG